jgi:hypothetical protein
MTHFTVGIIVPDNELSPLDNFVSGQMEPYCEHTEVEPYVCYSIDRAKAEIERDIRRLERIIERQDQVYNLDKCRNLLEEIRRITPEEKYREYVKHHESFNAKGEPLSTSRASSNPFLNDRPASSSFEPAFSAGP